MAADLLVGGLPAVHRVALAYAPAHAHAAWLGLLALDARLAQLVRETREPMLGQIRLAWWRERLGEALPNRPKGEPLLALLGEDRARLMPLVDGWEALLGEAPLPPEAIAAFSEGRSSALVALAVVLGCELSSGDVEHAGRNWALADLALRLSHPKEREHAAALLTERKPRVLPRAMRPLSVLEGLAIRDLQPGNSAGGIGPLLTTLRLGIFGR